MSLNRQRPSTRVNSRATTLPSLSNTTINTENTAVTTTEFLPSIEESLQDWLTRSIPDTPSSSVSWLLDTCRCCNRNECENLETLSSAMRKLEADSRLAAEIGQSLLHKHEQYVSESNDVKNGLEQEVEQLREKVSELEQSLSDSDNMKRDLIQEKDRSVWEWQKTQKILEETAIDLETSNHRCLQLGSELKSKINEVEKLRIFKFMARQADIREDTLRAKLEDIKQELAISRKAELTLESKYKKLKTKYESTSLSFEKLKLDQQEMGMTKDHQLDLVWLRESNEKLRRDVLKLTSALMVPNSADDLHMTSSSNNYNRSLIELIKELASANNKLKTDLLDCSDLLMECRNDLYTKLDQQQDEIMHNDDTIQSDADNQDDDSSNKWLSTSAPQSNEESSIIIPKLLRRTVSKRSNSIEEGAEDNETGTTIVTQHDNLGNTENTPTNIVVPQSSISLPTDTPPNVVHHHYHYHMKKKLIAEKGKLNKSHSRQSIGGGMVSPYTENEENNNKLALPPKIILSPSSSEKLGDLDTSSPFQQLYNQITNVLQRLQQTDIRTLNRRLRRAFDIFELSSMSNSIIENIITDVDGLRTRFLWIEDFHSIVKQEPWIHDLSMLHFFPIIEIVQEMLKEICQLRTTMNDLQVEYVKKVEESDVRLEEDLLKKQQEKKHQQQAQSKQDNTNSNNKVTLSSWISNVFQRKAAPEQNQPFYQQPQNDQQQQHQSQNSRFVINNNSSDISIATTTNSSIHPLSIPANNHNLLAPSNSNTTSTEKTNMIAIIRRKKSDIDRYGPPSSFPTRSPSVAIGNEKNKRRSATAIATSNASSASPNSINNNTLLNNKPFPVTLRASQSAGTVRRSKSMQAPALEYVVRRKRSTLGLNSSSLTDYDLLISPQTSSSDMTGTFVTSWLGNK